MHHTPSEAEKRFGSQGTQWCNMALFDVDGATKVIRDCKQDRIPLLGIEGFIPFGEPASGERVLTSTADILDLSDRDRTADGTYDLCQAFVTDPTRQGMHFEFVFGD